MPLVMQVSSHTCTLNSFNQSLAALADQLLTLALLNCQ